MSQKQKRPGTTTPTDRIVAKVDERLNNIGKDKEQDPNRKTGSKYGKRKRARKNPKPKLNRKQGSRKDFNKETKTEEINMSIVKAAKYIIENHGKDVNEIANKYGDVDTLKLVASKCMATCLGGWKVSEQGLVSENTNMVLSKDSWVIAEDGSAKLENGFKFNYDWLYDLANVNPGSTITEDIDETEMDTDIFSDTLTNAAAILRKLSDKEIKKYVLNAAKEDEDVDIMNLRDIIEETGVNWKFIGAEVDGDKVNLFVRVKYTKDGTQEGVVEKKLSIEVKPSADVSYVEKEEITDDDVNLEFKPESEDLDLDIEKADIDIERPEDETEITPEDLPKEEEEEPIAGFDLEL